MQYFYHINNDNNKYLGKWPFCVCLWRIHITLFFYLSTSLWWHWFYMTCRSSPTTSGPIHTFLFVLYAWVFIFCVPLSFFFLDFVFFLSGKKNLFAWCLFFCFVWFHLAEWLNSWIVVDGWMYYSHRIFFSIVLYQFVCQHQFTERKTR